VIRQDLKPTSVADDRLLGESSVVAHRGIENFNRRFSEDRRSRIDQVEAPSIGHAFEVVNATILKPDSRLGHQVLHCARDQYFAGARLCSYTRANMNRDADDLISNQFVFARMQTRPDLQPESADGLTDCSRQPQDRSSVSSSAQRVATIRNWHSSAEWTDVAPQPLERQAGRRRNWLAQAGECVRCTHIRPTTWRTCVEPRR
jgi:hypothetical protein